jgi:hypothetical protein
MSENNQVKTLPVGKRIIGILIIVLVIGVSFLFGLWIAGTFESGAPSPESEDRPDFLFSVVTFVFGCIVLSIGIASYFIVLGTCCFTYDFSRPFFRSFRLKIYLATIVVLLFVALGFGLFVSAFISPILVALGISSTASFLIPVFAAFVVVQLFLFWLQIWVPLEKKIIIRRLAALGIPPQYIQTGIYIGISDPAKSSFKKTMVEDDCGMLWITPSVISYRGDAESFDIQQGQLIEIERKADPGSITALVGGVDLILKFQKDDGQQRRVRFHSEACWTPGAKNKAIEELANEITQWEESIIDVTMEE